MSKSEDKKMSSASKQNKRPRKENGFAETKEYPHKKHPAKFKKKRGSDMVIYITFTHSEEVDMGDKTIQTIPLNSNINHKERGTKRKDGKPNISYAYPKVYVGTRSALGKGTDKYSLTEADKALVDELFKLLPQEQVPKTSNSKQTTRKSRK